MRLELRINSEDLPMAQLPDSYWLRHMIEGLVLQVEVSAPSGLLSQDIISSANAIQAYLEEYDRLGAAMRRLPPAPHGHQEQEN